MSASAPAPIGPISMGDADRAGESPDSSAATSRRFASAGNQRIPRPDRWRLSVPRRWMLPPRTELFERLSALPDVTPASGAGDLRPSAVLVGLGSDDAPSAGADVLLTRRSQHLRNHAGEISFPGGRIDAGESPVTAATREAFEEVALPADGIDVLGELTHHQTLVSSSHIIPVVAKVARSADLRPNPDEVERILWLPLTALTAPDVYHGEVWSRGAAEFTLHFFEVGAPFNETVWGATASMLVNLLDLVANPAQGHGAGVPTEDGTQPDDR